MQIREAINDKTLQSILKEDEIQECGITGKIVATVSWDEKDVILMHLLPGTAVNSYCVIGTLRSLIACLYHIFSSR
jgi:hypothetical protein